MDPRNFHDEALGLQVDVRRMGLTRDALADLPLPRAYDAMAALEAGAVANADEGRRVGHYWLRAPALAPPDARAAIEASHEAIARLVDRARGRFDHLILIGIGGSALGPQLVADALCPPGQIPAPVFIDNTDPEGVARALAGVELSRALAVVTSKSGGTAETRNGMLAVQAAYARAGVAFAPRAVAITGLGSKLDRLAVEQGWMARLPMWDWVGGRTSVCSAVGLAPMALMGLDWRALLAGAAACDAITRGRRPGNPAALLAASWFSAGGGKGRRAMVVLPYRDRLILMSRYLQQLVMESLGKRLDRAGREARQGLAVYGNKGSTDQHAFVQQLRDGPDDCFATFVAALEDGGEPLEVEPGVTSGDYLLGFLLGTRQALTAAGRRSMTLVIRRVDAWHLGVLIALFERAVGLYAELIDVNAYHQPGVEAGKLAAAEALRLQAQILAGASATGDDAELIRARLAAMGRL